MRIIFVVGHLANGGAEREAATFASTLANMGNEVHIVCMWNDEPDYSVDEKVAIHTRRVNSIVRIPVLKGACNIATVLIQLRRLAGDIIIPFCLAPEYCLWFRPVTLFTRTRLLYAVRNVQQKSFPSRKDRWLDRYACSFVDGIWVQTEDQRKFYSKRLQEKIFVVPNVLSRQFLEIQKPDRENISRLISVGRIHPQKNQKMLIQAFAKMIERTGNQEATLSIYGKVLEKHRATKDELNALIREYHLDDRVFLPGRVRNIDTKYAEADAFVFSSDYEGCPNALMEAMAVGLPCISTDCPTGPSMIIENGKNGLLVPVGDVDAMAHAMESLILDPQWANELGAAAKERMRRWGDEKELSEELLIHFKKICT